jgi:peptidoglycan/xylan/chitin deacetylase (PgdA/CDA1 family)
LPKTSGIVVITLHNIEPIYYKWFSKLIDQLSSKFEFINFEDFEKYRDCDDIKILLTFDDGFYSNRYVAEKYLSKHDIKALFFITEGFIELFKEDSYNFSKRNFYPNSNIETKKNFLNAMSWDDIAWLIEKGHSIGAHTQTHPKLNTLDNNSLYEEIISSTNRIEKRLGIDINTFAFPFGTPEYIDKNSLEIGKEKFKYIFSNVRGDINSSPSNYFIFRQNIVPGDSIKFIESIIEGKMDWKYKKMQKNSASILGLDS